MLITSQPNELKETRLAGDQRFAPAASEEVKATRLGHADAAGGYLQNSSGHYPAAQVAPGAPAQASFLGKLNWKHYAGAGAALLFVVAVTFALVSVGSKPAPQPQPNSAPSANPSTPPAQSEPASAPSGNAQQPNATPGVPANQQPVAGSTPTGVSNSRSRTSAAKTPETPIDSQPAPAQTAPQTQPAPKRENVAASKPEPEKKEPEKKPEEKKRGLFGRLKDAITGNEKKKDKKP